METRSKINNMNIDLTEEEKLKKKLSKAGSIMGKMSALKNPKTKEFLSEIGKKGMAVRWGKKDTT